MLPHSFRALKQTSALLQIVLLCLLMAQPVYAIDRGVADSPCRTCSENLPLEEEWPGPLGGSTEENVNSGLSLTEEFLHGLDVAAGGLTGSRSEFLIRQVSTYVAFHGEQTIPPPDAD